MASYVHFWGRERHAVREEDVDIFSCFSTRMASYVHLRGRERHAVLGKKTWIFSVVLPNYAFVLIEVIII